MQQILKKHIYITLAFLCFQIIITTYKVKAQSNADSAFEFIKDDPIVAMLDSMQLTKFFTCNSYFSDSCFFDASNYKTNHVPYFDDLVYEARLAMLDVKTPFDLVYNNAVKAYISLYADKRRNLVSRLLGMSQIYFPMFEEKLSKYNLPLELKYLAIVESALNPIAVSKSGAAGLWQFMYPTGKMFGLEINSYVDDRKDPLKATEAACHYFTYLYAMFGDWQMVLAAYNCGPGTLNKAIRRSGGKKTYWEIRPYLPTETQSYVPAFIAVNYIMNHTLQHNLLPIPVKQSYFFADTVQVKQPLTFDAVSSVLNISMEDLVYLNPSYKLKKVPAFGQFNALYLPAGKIGSFILNENAIYAYRKAGEISRDELLYAAKKTENITTRHKVRKGEKLISIAKKYHCSVTDIKTWNKLKQNTVKTGTILYVYNINKNESKNSPIVSENVAVSDTLKNKTEQVNNGSAASSAMMDEKQITEKTTYHVIQKGDTLWNISNKYKMSSVGELMRINNLHKNYKLIPGTKIKVIVAG